MPIRGFEAEAVKSPKSSDAQIGHDDCHRHRQTTQPDFNRQHRAACVRQDSSHAVLPEIELFQGSRDATNLATSISERALANIKSPMMQDEYLTSLESFVLGLASGANTAKEKSKAETKAAWRDVSSGNNSDKAARARECLFGLLDTANGAIDAVCKDPLAPGKALMGAALAMGSSTEQFVAASPISEGEVLGELAFWGFNPEGKAAEAHEALAALSESRTVSGIKSRYLELEEAKAAKEPMRHRILPEEDEHYARPEKFKDKAPPSEQFKREFGEWLSRAPKDHVSFLLDKGVTFNACHGISDVLSDGDRTLGVYIHRGSRFAVEDKSIFVGETYVKEGKHEPTPHPEWTFRHEMGHALSHNARSDGKRLSEDRRFIIAYEKDWSKLTPEDLDWFTHHYQSYAKENRPEEIFADLYAHRSGLMTNGTLYERSKQLVKEHFPTCYETMPKLLAKLGESQK